MMMWEQFTDRIHVLDVPGEGFPVEFPPRRIVNVLPPLLGDGWWLAKKNRICDKNWHGFSRGIIPGMVAFQPFVWLIQADGMRRFTVDSLGQLICMEPSDAYEQFPGF
jgi:hypothetical protein